MAFEMFYIVLGPLKAGLSQKVLPSGEILDFKPTRSSGIEKLGHYETRYCRKKHYQFQALVQKITEHNMSTYVK